MSVPDLSKIDTCDLLKELTDREEIISIIVWEKDDLDWVLSEDNEHPPKELVDAVMAKKADIQMDMGNLFNDLGWGLLNTYMREQATKLNIKGWTNTNNM